MGGFFSILKVQKTRKNFFASRTATRIDVDFEINGDFFLIMERDLKFNCND